MGKTDALLFGSELVGLIVLVAATGGITTYPTDPPSEMLDLVLGVSLLRSKNA